MNTEEEHLEKIEKLNQLISEIQRKLDAGDYMIHEFSEFNKPINYIHVQLPDLNVYLSPIKTSIEGHFYYKNYKDFKAPYVLIHNNVFKKDKIIIDDNALAHELQHFLDYKQNMKFTGIKNILKPEGGINPAYYNDITEWRAFTIQFLRQYFQVVKLKKLTENFKMFFHDFFKKTNAKEFYKNLTMENREKFNEYLQKFHQKLLERKYNELSNLISEEVFLMNILTEVTNDNPTLLSDLMKEPLEENQKPNLSEQDYRGSHQAPSSANQDSPMYDLTQVYGEDIYGKNALRYFGHQPYDAYSINLIQSVRNKPNARVKIYRAVPKVITNQEKINDYLKQKAYVLKTGRIPQGIDNWNNKSEYYEYLDNEIQRLKTLPEEQDKVRINDGDWVTINPAYAREHGKSNLNNNYRVLTKTVSAKNLFNEGDINEWGYSI